MFPGWQQGRRDRTAEGEAGRADERDGVAVVRRRRGRRDGADAGGLAVRALQAEHPAARLEEAVRRRVLQEDHILQLGERQAEHHRPRYDIGSQVIYLFYGLKYFLSSIPVDEHQID